jgi:hypothetical protein
MDVVGRTTTMRKEIHTEAPSEAKARDWASRSEKLSEEAKALKVSQEDLVIEAAGLATRLSALAKDLRALEQAEKRGPGKDPLAHKRVISSSEMVEVIKREPAAKCAGGTALLKSQHGQLSPEKIQAVLRDRFSVIRTCYEDGLKRDPKLQGRIAVRFVIGVDGKVSSAASIASAAESSADIITPSTSSLPPLSDKVVIECVVGHCKSLEFPKPDGGQVSVVYPFAFSSK